MSGVGRSSARTRGRVAVAAGCMVLLACALLTSALGQERGVTPMKDTIFARKIMMGAIGTHMDEIETMLAPGGTLDLAEAQEQADTISIMLMAFPHMFPASTNQWETTKDRDPATDTYASPDVWSNFKDFYQRAAAASKIALEASQAKHAQDFKTRIAELRVACDSCHGLYQKTD